MLGRLVLLFLLTPALELGLLIQVDRLIGFGPTIGLIIVTGIVGSVLARREGASTWHRLNERLHVGDVPGTELADGVIILVSGALLITPGVLTDVVGFLGLIPFTRRPIRRVLVRWLQSKIQEGSAHFRFGVFGGQARGPNGGLGDRRSPANSPADGAAPTYDDENGTPDRLSSPREADASSDSSRP